MKFFNQYKSWFKAFFITFVVLLVSSILFKEFKNVDFKKIVVLFRELDTFKFVMIIVLGLIAVLVLSVYDVILNDSLKLKVPFKTLLMRSYITNGLNNILGFGGTIGAGLRMFNYEPFAKNRPLGKAVTSMLFAMYAGLSFFCLLMVIGLLPTFSLPGNFHYVTYVIGLFTLYLPVYLLLSYFKPFSQEQRFFGLKQAVASVFDWTAAALLMYIILNVLHIDISVKAFATMFILAAVSGILSMLPGGIGAFDLVILVMLQSVGITEERAFLALLLYRISYYFFPFLMALALSIVAYKDDAKDYIEEQKWLQPAVETQSFIKSLLENLKPYYSNFALSLICLVTSLVYYFNHFLIVYEAIDTKQYFYHFILLIFNISGSLMLLICSAGILFGTMRSLLMSIIATALLLITSALSYATPVTYVWLIVLLVLLIIKLRRPNVVKRSVTPRRLFFSIIVIFIVGISNHILTREILSLYPHVQTHFDAQVRGLLVWISLLCFALLNMVISYYYARKYSIQLQSSVDDQAIQSILDQYGGNYVSHLAFSGDKFFFVNETNDAFLMYQVKRNAYIVLGDPIGNDVQFEALLKDFYNKVEFLGADILFYQVHSNNLALYHSFGNTFFKLGEEAVIPLSDFTLSGKKQRAFRATMNKAEKEGYTFEIIKPPFDEIYPEIKSVSDAWLGKKREMNFSVGACDLDYLNHAPIGIIKNSNSEIVAFTTFMPTYHKNSLSVDLIRWKETDLPMMDILYLNMLQYAKDEHYDYFNMGMATLSNVGQNKYAFLREKIAGQVFENFNGMYSFEGLRKYKQKFNPEWQERYLVYRKYSSLLWNILRITALINSKK